MMEMVLVTGMAGAGKTSALDALEDIGFYAVDNLPLAMLIRPTRPSPTCGVMKHTKPAAAIFNASGPTVSPIR